MTRASASLRQKSAFLLGDRIWIITQHYSFLGWFENRLGPKPGKNERGLLQYPNLHHRCSLVHSSCRKQAFPHACSSVALHDIRGCRIDNPDKFGLRQICEDPLSTRRIFLFILS
jgi:hypothetical protein